MQEPSFKELLTSKPNAEGTIPLVFGSDLAMAAQHNREQRIHSLDYPGRLEKSGLIASGGMGGIHHVYDHAMNRSVALKTLKDPWKDDAIVMDAFLTEARLTAQLHTLGLFLFMNTVFCITAVVTTPCPLFKVKPCQST